MPFCVLRAALAAAVALACGAAASGLAYAQGQGLRLDRSLGAPPSGRGPDLPTFVTADRIEGLGQAEVEASGNAELRRGDTALDADRIRYFVDTDEVEATGNVRLRVGGDEVTGPRLRLRVGDSTGIFESPRFKFAPREVQARQRSATRPVLTATEPEPQISVEGRGEAAAVRFSGEGRYRATDAKFTTCKPGQDDWFIQAGELDIDSDRQVGTAYGGRLTFLGAPTPRIPWFTFSLNDERKTGFLPPRFGIQNKSGFEFTLPFYWNIAPNYDATISPRYMANRGLLLANEFRFLQPWARGTARYEVLPQDRLLDRSRHATAFHTELNFQPGLRGLVNYNEVSDDNYFRDLSSSLAIATQANLPQEGALYYNAPVGWWNAGLRWQRFQTLQDPANPIAPPYFREPQVTLNVFKQTQPGFDLGLQSELVDFRNSLLAPTGRRGIAYPSLAASLVASYGYLTPKIGVHTTYYDLTKLGGFADETQSRTVPIASADAGLFLERYGRWFGNDYLQTLEPRVYYLYVPFREQSQIPVFDTTTADFNFTQLFQENIFVGGDRIANANQLSLAATSRIIRPSDGQELVRAIIGRRYYFADQKVTIPGQPVRTDRISPLVVGLVGRVAPNWTADIGVQTRLSGGPSIDKLNAGVRYSPAPASIASVSYRFTDRTLTVGGERIDSIDVAAQWPLGRGFYGVGRYNYDLEGGKPVERLVGLEYNAGCWIIRTVAHEFQTATDQQTTVFYLQVEFNGLARIGSNPLELLRRSIPGYSMLEPGAPDTRALDFGPAGGAPAPLDTGTVIPYPSEPLSPYRTYQ
jgi:LPS-assembly protein